MSSPIGISEVAVSAAATAQPTVVLAVGGLLEPVLVPGEHVHVTRRG